MPKLSRKLDQLRTASQRCGVPYSYMRGETPLGGGSPESGHHGFALWVLNYMFHPCVPQLLSGVNLERWGKSTLDFISFLSPIGDDEQSHYTARPETMAARLLASPAAANTARGSNHHTEIKAYATRRKTAR